MCRQQAACERPHVWGPYGQGGHALWPLLPHWTAQASSFAVSPASPCAWNVCVTRKAPLLVSDSSSSGGSDSEDYQKAASAVDAVSRSPGREAPPRPTVARTEEAVGRCVGRGERGGPAQVQRVRLPGCPQVSAPPQSRPRPGQRSSPHCFPHGPVALRGWLGVVVPVTLPRLARGVMLGAVMLGVMLHIKWSRMGGGWGSFFGQNICVLHCEWLRQDDRAWVSQTVLQGLGGAAPTPDPGWREQPSSWGSGPG